MTGIDTCGGGGTGALPCAKVEVFDVGPAIPDADDDGVRDSLDNCPVDFNPDQADLDGDGVGAVCQVFICGGLDSTDESVCSGNGVCTALDNCDCFAGFDGQLCETANTSTCNGLSNEDNGVCSGNGVCVGQDTCDCFAQFSGASCQVTGFECFGEPSSSSSVCSDNGTCVQQDQCECDPGFSGSNCQAPPPTEGVDCDFIDSLDPAVCSGVGACVDFDNCLCDPGYIGSFCQVLKTGFGKDVFDPNVCSGHGVCSTIDSCSCDPDSIGSDCQTQTRKFVFVTSTISTGNLGGLAGADATCNSLASAAGLPGSYKAWLSDGTDSPATRFTQSPLPYTLPDGTIIALDYQDLTDGTLLAPINRTETSSIAPATAVWTFTKANGEVTTPPPFPRFNCADWRSAGFSLRGSGGTTNQIDVNWSGGVQIGCSSLARLFCFQQ